MIKGIFFDLYGTLFIYGDMKQAWQDWIDGLYMVLYEEAGLTQDQKSFSQHCDGFFSSDNPPPHQDLTLYERRLHALCQTLNINLTNPSTLQRAVAQSIGPWQNHISLDTETSPVLQKLKTQYTLGLISNFDHAPHVYALLQKHNLTSLFEIIVISGDIEIDKPDPEIFHRALNAVNLSPAQVAYVGDNPIDDIQGAQGVGMHPIWISRSTDDILSDYTTSDQTDPSSKPEVPDNVPTISKLSQLFDVIQ